MQENKKINEVVARKNCDEGTYISDLKFVLFDCETQSVFLYTKPETKNPNQVLIGEL